MSFWESIGFQSRTPKTKKPHEIIRERSRARNAEIAELERAYETAAKASEAAATTVANAATRGLLVTRRPTRSKFSSKTIPRTAPQTLVVVPTVSPNNAAAANAATKKANATWAREIRHTVESETMAERLGQIEAIERQIDSETVTKRDIKRLKDAKEDLEDYVERTKKSLTKSGATHNQIHPKPVEFEGEFDPIRNGNGPIEHYVVFGSSRKPQTGIGKALGNAGLNFGDWLRGVLKAIPSILIALVILGAVLAAAIGTRNVYVWIVVIVLLAAGIGGVIWKGIV